MRPEAKIITFLFTRMPEEARQFFEDVLELRLVADEPTALVFDSNGTMLRVSKVTDFTPQPFTVLGWEVSDIGSQMNALAGRGVTFEQFEGIPQDEQGIATFPDGTQVAWFKDPDGNLLSLTQF